MSLGVNTGYNAYSTMQTAAVRSNIKETEFSDAEKLEAFKKELWNEIDSLPWNRGLNLSIQITDEAFEKMMNDPEFKNQVMTNIRTDARISKPPIITVVMLKVDKHGYSGSSYSDEAYKPGMFEAHSAGKVFYTRKAKNKKNEYQQVWDSYKFQQALLEQRMLQKKLQDDNLKNGKPQRYPNSE